MPLASAFSIAPSEVPQTSGKAVILSSEAFEVPLAEACVRKFRHRLGSQTDISLFLQFCQCSALKPQKLKYRASGILTHPANCATHRTSKGRCRESESSLKLWKGPVCAKLTLATLTTPSPPRPLHPFGDGGAAFFLEGLAFRVGVEFQAGHVLDGDRIHRRRAAVARQAGAERRGAFERSVRAGDVGKVRGGVGSEGRVPAALRTVGRSILTGPLARSASLCAPCAQMNAACPGDSRLLNLQPEASFKRENQTPMSDERDRFCCDAAKMLQVHNVAVTRVVWLCPVSSG